MRTLLAGAMLLALVLPAAASDCVLPDRSVPDDKAATLADGFTYLGPRTLPFSDNLAFYYARAGVLYQSIYLDGCVAGAARAVGRYVPGQGI